MLSIAINVLFACAGLLAAGTIVHSLREARAAWVRLMREGEVLRAGLALQASATPMSLRPAPPRPGGMRRMATLPSGLRPRPACAAA